MTDETQNDDLYISTDIESAIIQGNRERFDELIDDADLSHQSDNDSTLLHKAAIVGEIELASELIDRGIDLDAQDYSNPTHRYSLTFVLLAVSPLAQTAVSQRSTTRSKRWGGDSNRNQTCSFLRATGRARTPPTATHSCSLVRKRWGGDSNP